MGRGQKEELQSGCKDDRMFIGEGGAGDALTRVRGGGAALAEWTQKRQIDQCRHTYGGDLEGEDATVLDGWEPQESREAPSRAALQVEAA